MSTLPFRKRPAGFVKGVVLATVFPVGPVCAAVSFKNGDWLAGTFFTAGWLLALNMWFVRGQVR